MGNCVGKSAKNPKKPIKTAPGKDKSDTINPEDLQVTAATDPKKPGFSRNQIETFLKAKKFRLEFEFKTNQTMIENKEAVHLSNKANKAELWGACSVCCCGSRKKVADRQSQGAE